MDNIVDMSSGAASPEKPPGHPNPRNMDAFFEKMNKAIDRHFAMPEPVTENLNAIPGMVSTEKQPKKELDEEGQRKIDEALKAAGVTEEAMNQDHELKTAYEKLMLAKAAYLKTEKAYLQKTEPDSPPDFLDERALKGVNDDTLTTIRWATNIPGTPSQTVLEDATLDIERFNDRRVKSLELLEEEERIIQEQKSAFTTTSPNEEGQGKIKDAIKTGGGITEEEFLKLAAEILGDNYQGSREDSQITQAEKKLPIAASQTEDEKNEAQAKSLITQLRDFLADPANKDVTESTAKIHHQEQLIETLGLKDLYETMKKTQWEFVSSYDTVFDHYRIDYDPQQMDLLVKLFQAYSPELAIAFSNHINQSRLEIDSNVADREELKNKRINTDAEFETQYEAAFNTILDGKLKREYDEIPKPPSYTIDFDDVLYMIKTDRLKDPDETQQALKKALENEIESNQFYTKREKLWSEFYATLAEKAGLKIIPRKDRFSPPTLEEITANPTEPVSS